MMQANLIQRRVRIAGVLVLTGLMIEFFSLHWASPVAFLLAAFIGIPLAGIGALLFLYSLVSLSE